MTVEMNSTCITSGNTIWLVVYAVCVQVLKIKTSHQFYRYGTYLQNKNKIEQVGINNTYIPTYLSYVYQL